MPWFVYLARCSDESLYCGITTDVDRRIKEHNEDWMKGSTYCWARRPVRAVWFEQCKSRSWASRREHQIKSLTRDQKEALINDKE